MDFEAFVGEEKAKEFRALFTAWIQKIYRALFPEIHPLTTVTDHPTQPPANGVCSALIKLLVMTPQYTVMKTPTTMCPPPILYPQ